MKETLARFLKAICDEYGYLCCMAAPSPSEQLITVGNVSGLRWRGLVDSLFGDANAVIQLNDSLEGQLLPQVYGQGEVSCVVMKPLDNLLVGLFHQGGKDPLLLYNEGKEISRRIANEIRCANS